ncbi:MAG: hypothetical protein N3F65_00855 [Nitrososphaeria archaeon]|nr:hypothetical protein [Aigarchaeota archaeon]MCX8187145.1 hypothetical protein [Nitrososphaeria archaeon]MDW8021589.1 hypothetical protein [Nitrososphaerota archaeon]
MLLLYLITLITLQALGVLYFLRKPSIYVAILLTILLGTILPILLALIFIKLVKLT